MDSRTTTCAHGQEADADATSNFRQHDPESGTQRREVEPTPARGSGSANDHIPLVVVTGGSKGIGRSCVESFARCGARVLFTYCSDAQAALKVERAFQPPGRVQSRPLDQGDFDSVRSFAAEVDRWRNGRELDTVVNNAALGVATVSTYKGLPSPPPTMDDASAASTANSAEKDGNAGVTTFDAARRRAEEDVALMRVNALGPMWVTEALLPMMEPPARLAADVASGDDGAHLRSGEECQAGTGVKPHTAQAIPSQTLTPASSMKVTATALHSEPASTSGTKRTVLFVGSVGGGSQSVFPGFRAADAMSKAAVAYASKHFAARSRLRLRESAPRASVALETAAVDLPKDTPNSVADGDDTSSARVDVGRAAAATSAAMAAAESDLSGGVDFVCLCPGATLTDMFRASTLDKLDGPAELNRFLRALPKGRLMLPEEVGEAVHWLCSSPAATMFHGAVIDASAGLAVRPGRLTEYSF